MPGRMFTLPDKTVKTALSFTATGDNTILTGVAGKIWSVYRLHLAFTSAATVIIKSGTTVLATYPAITSLNLFDLAPDEDPYFKAVAAGDSLIVNLSGTIVSGGFMETKILNEASEGLGYT